MISLLHIDIQKYDLVIAPALIVLPGVAETLEHYVSDGGNFVTIIWRVCMTA